MFSWINTIASDGCVQIVPLIHIHLYTSINLGEAAARVYYTEWSPPVGTLPPPGTVLPVIQNQVQSNPPLPQEPVAVVQEVKTGDVFMYLYTLRCHMLHICYSYVLMFIYPYVLNVYRAKQV